MTVDAQFTAPTADKPGRLFVTATIKPGWHIYSITQPPGGPLAAKIDVKPPQGVRVILPFKASDAPKLKPEPDAYGDLRIEIHEDMVTWYAPIELAKGVDPAALQISGVLTVSACDAKSCQPPKDLPFSASVGPGMAVHEEPAGKAASLPAAPAPPVDLRFLLVQLASAFLGGFLLNFMPCVLPVISLKVLAFVQQAGESRGRVFLLNVCYSLGMLAVFMVLAALATGIGAAVGIERLSWGQQFTNVGFKITMTALVFVMALSFLGVWEIPIPGFVGTGKANELQAKEGPSGAFFKGVFTTILATPCSAPILGSVFGWLLTQPPYMVYCTFGAVGLGMASPYLVIGAFPALIRLLPRPGAWMDTFKQLMGFFLLATVVYLFNSLTILYIVPTLTLLIGLWFACWWIGRTPLTKPVQRIVAWCGGAAVAAVVGYFAFTILLQPSKIAWQPFSPAAVERARADGKTVMVDFTANWCLNCKLNSRRAIETDAVRKLVEDNGVVPLLADWTDESPMIKKALTDLGCNSIPTLAIWPAEPPGSKPIILPDVLPESKVLDALKAAGPSKKP